MKTDRIELVHIKIKWRYARVGYGPELPCGTGFIKLKKMTVCTEVFSV